MVTRAETCVGDDNLVRLRGIRQAGCRGLAGDLRVVAGKLLHGNTVPLHAVSPGLGRREAGGESAEELVEGGEDAALHGDPGLQDCEAGEVLDGNGSRAGGRGPEGYDEKKDSHRSAHRISFLSKDGVG